MGLNNVVINNTFMLLITKFDDGTPSTIVGYKLYYFNITENHTYPAFPTIDGTTVWSTKKLLYFTFNSKMWLPS